MKAKDIVLLVIIILTQNPIIARRAWFLHVCLPLVLFVPGGTSLTPKGAAM